MTANLSPAQSTPSGAPDSAERPRPHVARSGEIWAKRFRLLHVLVLDSLTDGGNLRFLKTFVNNAPSYPLRPPTPP